MKGNFQIHIFNNKKDFKFIICKNITIVQGDSGKGKTTLVSMVEQYSNSGAGSGINVQSDIKLLVLTNSTYKSLLEEYTDKQVIFFIDESNDCFRTIEFARALRKSGCYCVIMTRESIKTLPYGITNIYIMIGSGKYSTLKSKYKDDSNHNISDWYRYALNTWRDISKIYTEDARSSYYLLRNICGTESLHGNGITKEFILSLKPGDALFVDGAGFGPYIDYVQERLDHVSWTLFAPTCFEAVLILSGILKCTEKFSFDYYDSIKYFSVEGYFEFFAKNFSISGYDKSDDLEIYKSKQVQDKFMHSL